MSHLLCHTSKHKDGWKERGGGGVVAKDIVELRLWGVEVMVLLTALMR